MTELADSLNRLQDELARARRPGTVAIHTDALLVLPGDVYAIRSVTGMTEPGEPHLRVVAHPMDVAAIRAVFREWDWTVTVHDKPPRPEPEPEPEPEGNAILGIMWAAVIYVAVAVIVTAAVFLIGRVWGT